MERKQRLLLKGKGQEGQRPNTREEMKNRQKEVEVCQLSWRWWGDRAHGAVAFNLVTFDQNKTNSLIFRYSLTCVRSSDFIW